MTLTLKRRIRNLPEGKLVRTFSLTPSLCQKTDFAISSCFQGTIFGEENAYATFSVGRIRLSVESIVELV